MAMLLTPKPLGVYCEPMISRLHRHRRTFTALSSPPALARPSYQLLLTAAPAEMFQAGEAAVP